MDTYIPSRPPRTPPAACAACGRPAPLFVPDADGPRCIACALGGCAQCGCSAPPYLVADGDRRCLACLDAVPADGTWLIGGLPPWELDDGAWFKAHPHRQLRLRAAWPGELFLLGYKDARERIAAAARARLTVVIVVKRQAHGRLGREPGNSPAGDLDSFIDSGIEWLAEGRRGPLSPAADE
jgi:hypothetical protein